MGKCKVAITIRTFDHNGEAYKKLEESCNIIYENTTGKRLTAAELARAITKADGVIVGTEPFSAEVIGASPALKVISRVGVGLDSIDLDTARERGVTIKNTPDAPVMAVAEHTLALMLAVLKQIPAYNDTMRHGDQSPRKGFLLAKKVVGIIGMGRIGFQVASMLESLGCRIVFYDPNLSRDIPARWIQAASLTDLVRISDIVSIHASPAAGGRALVDEKLLSESKRGIILINTARGSLIDEDALIKALDDGRVWAAGLDVLPQEPYNGRLIKYPQVILTPHVASNTVESREQMEMEAVNNLILSLEVGKP